MASAARDMARAVATALAAPSGSLRSDMPMPMYPTDGSIDPNVPPPNNYVGMTLTILHHWSAATGRDLKAAPVAVRAR